MGTISVSLRSHRLDTLAEAGCPREDVLGRTLEKEGSWVSSDDEDGRSPAEFSLTRAGLEQQPRPCTVCETQVAAASSCRGALAESDVCLEGGVGHLMSPPPLG